MTEERVSDDCVIEIDEKYMQSHKSWAEKRRERKSSLHGGWPFRDYPIDTFYTRPFFDFFVIDEGYTGVRLNAGRLGKKLVDAKDALGNFYTKKIDSVDDDGNVTTKDGLVIPKGNVTRMYRGFPGGGEVEPGLRFMLSLGGLWGKTAVVYTGLRTEEIKVQDLRTQGNVKVDLEAVLYGRVADPVKAMTEVSNFREAYLERTEAQLRNVFSSFTLDEISQHARMQHTNYADLGDFRASLLEETGFNATRLAVQKTILPEELQTELAQRVIKEIAAEGEARERERLADAAAYAAKKFGEGAEHLTPEAIQIMLTQAGLQEGKEFGYQAHWDQAAKQIKEGFKEGIKDGVKAFAEIYMKMKKGK